MSIVFKPNETDEEIITKYRNSTSPKDQTKIFNHLLKRRRSEDKSSWEVVMKKYVKWRLNKSSSSFDIYDESDLYQRCLCCFFKAASEKYTFDKNTKFSTYMYSALEKTVNRVLVELRKKKRTLMVNGKRVSPRYFTSSLDEPINNDDKSMTRNEMIADVNEDELSDNESLLVDNIMQKCKKYLTPMQYEIFIKGDIQGTISGKDLAKKFDKSEPTISAIKKRKIAQVLSQIRQEVVEEMNLPKIKS